ncbi:MAG: Asp-tRNA(Asn)/Glu-tRNA(Gln) amidotransferase subunit GatC [Bacillota bacterium]|nr:Asp-tRNA(Asn)/Glu-tRNA(Gln) amidotransferase subunit GatC [Bacillota bacterium]
MSLTVKDVEHVAKLSRLSFDDNEKKDFIKKLNSVVDYIEKLDEVDVEGVKPTYHALEVKNVFREDKVEKSFDRKEIIANAPSAEGGCFKVPKVVK